jgi:hypothetical protein
LSIRRSFRPLPCACCRPFAKGSRWPSVDFSTEGLETDSLLAKRLWATSQATHKPPWEILGFSEATEAWLDWTVEMSAKYPPGALKFERASDVTDRTVFQDSATAWSNVLAGDAARRFNERFVPKFLRAKKAK